ncbi:MAG TPA: AAA family ATPase, partial [Myxococcales bacterium]
MLLGLKISNIAIIDEAEVTLGPGLTVLTGETGAGKSILIDALGLLLGLRADAEVIRGGCDDASVEAIFERTSLLASRLSALGLPDLGDEVSVRRVVSRRSRGKVYVNGAMVTVGVLGTLMRGLLDISGQHESISLFDASLHRSILDRLGNIESLLNDYRQELKHFTDIAQRIADLGAGEQRIQQRIEFLKFQKDELDRLLPVAEEDKTLEEERRKLLGSEKLRNATLKAEQFLCTDEASVLEMLGKAISALTEASRIDLALDAIGSSLKTIAIE